MKTRSISGEHNFDLSSPSLDEVDEDSEDCHDTERMSRSDIQAALKQMGEAEDVLECKSRQETLRPPPPTLDGPIDPK